MIPIRDSVCASFELENGASAQLTSMWHNIPHDQRDMELFFENSYINLITENFSGTISVIEKEKGKYQIKSTDANLAFREALGWANHPPIWLECYGYEDIAFLQSLIEETPASPSLEECQTGA